MCQGEGVLRWRQPFPDGVLRDLEHPCPNGCGDTWTLPAAEEHQVIAPESGADAVPRRRGRADEVNDLSGDFVGRALEVWGFRDPQQPSETGC
jgi:hypothetical protein